MVKKESKSPEKGLEESLEALRKVTEAVQFLTQAQRRKVLKAARIFYGVWENEDTGEKED